MSLQTTKTYTFSAGGVTTVIPVINLPDIIVIKPTSGAVHLTGAVVFSTDVTPTIGTTWQTKLIPPIMSGGTITLFGEAVVYNSTFPVTYVYEFYIDGAGVQQFNLTVEDISGVQSIDGASIMDNSIDFPKLLNGSGAGRLIVSQTGDFHFDEVTQSGDILIGSTGVSAIQAGVIVNADVNASAAIARSKIATDTAGAVVTNDGGGVMSSELHLLPVRGGLGIDASGSTGFTKFSAGTGSISAITDNKVVSVSFVTASQCDNKIKFPFACTITGIYAYATTAIAATDVATITPKNAAGTTMTSSVITFSASDPIGTAYSSTPSANNTLAANDVMYLTSAKVTSGGTALVTITYTRNS